MNMTQKGAWFGVYLSALLVAVAIVDLIGILEYKGFPSPGVIVLHIVLVFVFFFLPVLWLERSRKKSKVEFDERDRLIIKRSLLVASVSLFGLLSVAYLVVLFILSPKVSITVSLLPDVVYGAFITFILIISIAVLVQYGWGNKGEKS